MEEYMQREKRQMSATAWRSIYRKPERKGPKPGSTQNALRFSNQKLVLGDFLTHGHVSVSLTMCVCTLKMLVFPCMCVWKDWYNMNMQGGGQGCSSVVRHCVQKSLLCYCNNEVCLLFECVSLALWHNLTKKGLRVSPEPSSNNTILLPQHNNSTTIKVQSSLL